MCAREFSNTRTLSCCEILAIRQGISLAPLSPPQWAPSVSEPCLEFKRRGLGTVNRVDKNVAIRANEYAKAPNQKGNDSMSEVGMEFGIAWMESSRDPSRGRVSDTLKIAKRLAPFEFSGLPALATTRFLMLLAVC